MHIIFCCYLIDFKLNLFRHLNGWAKFVHATKLCLKHIISMEELTEIRRLFCEFITYYEKYCMFLYPYINIYNVTLALKYIFNI